VERGSQPLFPPLCHLKLRGASPTMSAWLISPLDKRTATVVVPSTTWLFVTTWPAVSQMKSVPVFIPASSDSDVTEAAAIVLAG